MSQGIKQRNRSRRRCAPPTFLPPLLFLLALPYPLLAFQEPIRTLDVTEMTAKSAVIGVARVRAIQVREDSETRMLYTDASLEFEEIWKGTPPDPFILTQFGGQKGDRIAQIVGHQYSLDPKDSIVVFAVPWKDGLYFTLGLSQGLFRNVGVGKELVRESQRGARSFPGKSPKRYTLDSLRTAVYEELGIPVPARKAPSTDPKREGNGSDPAPPPEFSAPGRSRSSEGEAVVREGTPTSTEGTGFNPIQIMCGILILSGLALILLKASRPKKGRGHESSS